MECLYSSREKRAQHGKEIYERMIDWLIEKSSLSFKSNLRSFCTRWMCEKQWGRVRIFSFETMIYFMSRHYFVLIWVIFPLMFILYANKRKDDSNNCRNKTFSLPLLFFLSLSLSDILRQHHTYHNNTYDLWSRQGILLID